MPLTTGGTIGGGQGLSVWLEAGGGFRDATAAQNPTGGIARVSGRVGSLLGRRSSTAAHVAWVWTSMEEHGRDERLYGVDVSVPTELVLRESYADTRAGEIRPSEKPGAEAARASEDVLRDD